MTELAVCHQKMRTGRQTDRQTDRQLYIVEDKDVTGRAYMGEVLIQIWLESIKN